jgi:uncharacterized membrane protein YdbT with pleckstrin-like domain
MGVSMQNNNNHNQYQINQSNGYLNAQLISLQAIFLLIYAVLIALSPEGTTVLNIGGLLIGEFDVAFIMLGIIMQFAFSLVFLARWKNTSYAISDSNLIITSGLFTTDSRAIDLKDLVAPHSSQSLLGKYYDYGTVELKVRFGDNPIYLPGVPYPDKFIQNLNQVQHNN